MKFQKGDRVAVYGTNVNACSIDFERKVGMVFELVSDTRVKVQFPTEAGSFTFHSKQLRKLKPKKPIITREQIKAAYNKVFNNSPDDEYGCLSKIFKELGL